MHSIESQKLCVFCAVSGTFSLQVFFLENDEQHNGLSDPADHSRLTENVAKAFCLALCPHLKLLKEDGMTKLGLRVTLDADQVSPINWLWGGNTYSTTKTRVVRTVKRNISSVFSRFVFSLMWSFISLRLQELFAVSSQ